MSEEKKEVKIVAEVGDIQITEADVLNYIRTMNPQLAQQFHSEEGVKQIIDELIRQELLYLDAIENKFEEEDEFVKVLNDTKTSLIKSYAFSKSIEGIRVEEQEVLNYYDEVKDQFNKPNGVHAAHILVESEDKALEILEYIKEGEDFGKLAKEHSSCPSKENNGDLGIFYPGQMVPEFDKAVFDMEVGEISNPVKTQFGFHIIKLIEKIAEKESAFDDIREDLRMELLRQKQQKAYLDKINTLMDKYTVKVF